MIGHTMHSFDTMHPDDVKRLQLGLVGALEPVPEDGMPAQRFQDTGN